MEGPRAVRPEELEDLIGLLDLVFSPRPESSIGDDFPQIISEDNAKRLRVFVDKGKIVSHIGYIARDVSILGCTLTSGCLGSVATHPDYRRKGLATRLLYDVFELFRAEGGDFINISGGLGLYTCNGAVRVGRRYNMTVARERLDRFRATGMKVEQIVEKKQIPRAARLYALEPVWFLRPLDDWLFFLQSHVCMNRWAKAFMARANDASSYVIVGDRVKDGCLHVVDFAGDRTLLLGGCANLAEELGADRVVFPVVEWDARALELLRDIAAESEESAMPGTVRIVNFPQLIDRLRFRFEETLGCEVASSISASESDDKLLLRVGSMSHEYDAAGAAEMLFSGRNVPEDLREALPVPVPWLGMRYV